MAQHFNDVTLVMGATFFIQVLLIVPIQIGKLNTD